MAAALRTQIGPRCGVSRCHGRPQILPALQATTSAAPRAPKPPNAAALLVVSPLTSHSTSPLRVKPAHQGAPANYHRLGRLVAAATATTGDGGSSGQGCLDRGTFA